MSQGKFQSIYSIFDFHILKTTLNLISLNYNLVFTISVEDTIEMTEPHQVPPVGNCFLELAENLDFDVYDRYAETYDEDCRRMLEVTYYLLTQKNVIFYHCI